LVTDQFDNAQHVRLSDWGERADEDYQEKRVTAKTDDAAECASTREACGLFCGAFCRENVLDRICDLIEEVG